MRVAAFREDACVWAKIFDQVVPMDGLSETIVCETAESGYSLPLVAAERGPQGLPATRALE